MTVLGYVHFDAPNAKDHLVEFLVEREQIKLVRRNKWVRVTDTERKYLGRVVQGPLYFPEEVGRDSAFSQTAILHGGKFPAMPNFYASAKVELEGEIQDAGVVGISTRPQPKAKVEILPPDEVQKLINVDGDMLIGQLEGYDDIFVHFDSKDKKCIPRNLGIFGTVGSGKTNTAQVLIEEASAAGYAVIVLDVEGEYIQMDQPSTLLKDRLQKFKRAPAGVKDFQVLCSATGETDHEKPRRFSLRFEEQDPYVLAELIDASEAQERVLLPLLDDVKKIIAKKNKEAPKKGLKQAIGTESAEGEEASSDLAGMTIWDVLNNIEPVMEQAEVKGGLKSSYYALKGKLGKLARTGAFDRKECPAISADDLLVKGRVSVIDLAVDAQRVKNLVIADTLRKIYEKKLRKAKETPPTLIVIEEAHTFVSRENRERMEATLDMIRDISRRGRKRWLAMCFVSQQPSHLPQEIFELCNTLIIHGVKGESNLKALKTSAGDIEESYWTVVGNLGQGQAIISSPQFKYLIPTLVRPAATQRRFTE